MRGKEAGQFCLADFQLAKYGYAEGYVYVIYT
jgi:hypothetical protein